MSVRRYADLVVACATAVVTALATSCTGDPPRLQVSAVGGAPASARPDAVRVRYELRNVGGRALGLDGIAPVCGCRADTRLPEALDPGAAATLDVECRAPERAGETVRELVLHTGDPASPATTLRVALQSAVASPAPLYFGYVAVGESAVRDVVLPAAVALDGLVPSPRPELALEALPARADGAVGVRVRFTPQAAGIVRATLDLGAGRTLAATAVGFADVLAFPAEIALPAASGAAALPTVTLVGVGAAPLAITRVEYPPGTSGELKTVVPGRQYRLLLRGRGAPGEIRLHAATGDAPVLTIPVVAATAGDARGPAT
jgi:hypothetical protein